MAGGPSEPFGNAWGPSHESVSLGNVGRLVSMGGKCRSSFVPTERVGRALMISCAMFL